MPAKSLEPPTSPFIPYGFQFPRRRHAIPILDVQVSGQECGATRLRLLPCR